MAWPERMRCSALCPILNDKQAVFFSNGIDAVIVARKAKEIDGDYPLRGEIGGLRSEVRREWIDGWVISF